MSSKKLVLDFWPVKKPPEIDGTYFVLFKVNMENLIEYHFGYAEFIADSGWHTPSLYCIVHQWCALPSSKLLL